MIYTFFINKYYHFEFDNVIENDINKYKIWYYHVIIVYI